MADRSNLSLDVNKEGEFYDQICALSQKTINENFQILSDQRPDLMIMRYNDGDPDHGILMATSKAPQITLDVKGASKMDIYLTLRFLNGNISFGGKNATSLEDWIITVVAQIAEFNVSSSPLHSAEEAKKAESMRKEIDKSFEFQTEHSKKDPSGLLAGEYSIHRLFAAIQDHAWSTPVMDRSFAKTNEGNYVSLKEWESDTESNLTAGKVTDCLRRWATGNQHKPVFTLGVQLRKPLPSEDLLTPTFTPYAVKRQNYPYFRDGKYSDDARMEHDYNCFCYCETVRKKALPLGPQLPPAAADMPAPKRKPADLPYTGNLAAPADGSKVEIAGTFIMDHRRFLEQYLLPQLQELCVGTQVIPLLPKMFVDNEGWPIFQTRACLGGQPQALDDNDGKSIKDVLPEGLPEYILATDPYYQFQSKQPRGYVWEKTLNAPGSGRDVKVWENTKQGLLFVRRWTTSATTRVEVTWTKGDSKFKVNGFSQYRHWEGYAGFRSFNWGPEGGALWGSFTVNASWSLDLDLKPPSGKPWEGVVNSIVPNGVIQPRITLCDANWLPLDFAAPIPRVEFVLDKTPENIRDQISSNLSTSLKHMVHTLSQSFRGLGRFTYPGSGELKFGVPTLTEKGDIVATVDYLKPDASRILVGAPNTSKVPGPILRKPTVYTADPMVTDKVPHIAWQGVVNYNAQTKRAQITLTGSNKTDAMMAFKRVRVMMLAIKAQADDALFNARPTEWIELGKEPPKKQPSKKQPLVSPGNKQPSVSKENMQPLPPSESEKPVTQEGDGNEPHLDDGESQRPSSKTSDLSIPQESAVSLSGDSFILVPKGNEEVKVKPDIAAATSNAEDPQGQNDDTTATMTGDTADHTGPDSGASGLFDEVKTFFGGDKKPEGEEQPLPSEKWSLSATKVGQTLRLSIVLQDSYLHMFISPSQGNDRFTMHVGSSIKFILDGAVTKPGKYVLQLNEVWSSPIPEDDDPSDWADAFLAVDLPPSGGTGTVNVVTRSLADQIRGVETQVTK